MTQFSVREVPWMKIGKLVDSPKTSAEAAKLGGLDFDVQAEKIYFMQNGLGDAIEVADRRAIVRTDTWKPLGIMSADYPILQYRDAFDFMDGVSPEYVAAGALQDGRQGFMVVKPPEGHTLPLLDGADPHDLYVVLRTSHDGSRAVEVTVMPLRHRCMNQLVLGSFSKQVPWRWSIRHTSSMPKKLQDAKITLENLGAYAERLDHNAHRLIDMKVTSEYAQKVLTYVLPNRPKTQEKIDEIITSFETNTTTVGFNGTGWGLLQAVSEHFDWQRVGGSPASRFVGALQGQTHAAINRTASYLLTRGVDG